MLNGGVTADIPSRARLMSLKSDGSVKLNAGNSRIVEEDDSDSTLIIKQ